MDTKYHYLGQGETECKDLIPARKCKNLKRRDKCRLQKVQERCKETCGLCKLSDKNEIKYIAFLLVIHSLRLATNEDFTNSIHISPFIYDISKIFKVKTFQQQLQTPLKQHLIIMVCF